MYTEKIICNQYTEGILTVLNYNNRPVRKFYINGEIWLALSDICSVLNLTNPSSVASGMDSNEKMTISLASSHSGQRGGAQKLILVNIWGLIHWLNSSHKPEAKAFQRWVKTEVTHSTLKYGDIFSDKTLWMPQNWKTPPGSLLKTSWQIENASSKSCSL